MIDRAPLRVIVDPTPNRRNFPRRANQSFAVSADGARDAVATLGAEDADHPGQVIAEVLIAPDYDVDACFDATCEAVKEWLHENRDDIAAPGVAFLVDEVWSTSGRDMPEHFDYLARCGDLKKLQLVVTAHSPQDIPPKLRQIINFWFLFQTVDANALDVIRKRCGDDVADALPTLRKGEYIFFPEHDRANWRKVYNPDAWKPRD